MENKLWATQFKLKYKGSWAQLNLIKSLLVCPKTNPFSWALSCLSDFSPSRCHVFYSMICKSCSKNKPPITHESHLFWESITINYTSQYMLYNLSTLIFYSILLSRLVPTIHHPKESREQKRTSSNSIPFCHQSRFSTAVMNYHYFLFQSLHESPCDLSTYSLKSASPQVTICLTKFTASFQSNSYTICC